MNEFRSAFISIIAKETDVEVRISFKKDLGDTYFIDFTDRQIERCVDFEEVDSIIEAFDCPDYEFNDEQIQRCVDFGELETVAQEIIDGLSEDTPDNPNNKPQ